MMYGGKASKATSANGKDEEGVLGLKKMLL